MTPTETLCEASRANEVRLQAELQAIWDFPKTRGTLFWGPYNKDPTIKGTILGSLIFGNPHCASRYFSLPYFTILFSTVLCCVLCAMLYYTILYTVFVSTILYCTIPYSTTLCYTILYHIPVAHPGTPFHDPATLLHSSLRQAAKEQIQHLAAALEQDLGLGFRGLGFRDPF